MGDNKIQKDPKHLVSMLEGLLDELDHYNLIQTAARVASAVDTLKLEIERSYPDESLEASGAVLIRAAERD